jgi:hypothetical protein
MTDGITDEALDRLLRAADPLPADALPSQEETEAALHRLLAARQQAWRPRAAPRVPAPRTIASELGLRLALMCERTVSAVRPLAEHVRVARWRLLAGASVALGGVAAALLVLLGSAATQPAFAITQNADGTTTIVTFAPASALTSSKIAAFNQALAAVGAHTGGSEMLVATPSGLDVRCADGQLVQATLTTGTEWSTPATGNTGAGNTASGTAAGRIAALRAARRVARLASKRGAASTAGQPSERQPATDIKWQCPSGDAGNPGNTGTGTTGTG